MGTDQRPNRKNAMAEDEAEAELMAFLAAERAAEVQAEIEAEVLVALENARELLQETCMADGHREDSHTELLMERSRRLESLLHVGPPSIATSSSSRALCQTAE